MICKHCKAEYGSGKSKIYCDCCFNKLNKRGMNFE